MSVFRNKEMAVTPLDSARSELSKGLLALSALLVPSSLCTAHDESGAMPAKEVVSAPWTPLVLPYPPEVEKPVREPSVAGIGLLAGSESKDLLRRFDEAERSGQRPPPELTRDLFEALSQEPGTDVPPARFREILGRYPEDSVRAAMLKFIYCMPDMVVSDATLNQFWTSRDVDVLKWALLNQSKSITGTRSEAFFRNVRESPIPDIRIATSLALISAGFEPLKLNNNEILKASLLLTQEHLGAGHETRLVELMARNVAESGLTAVPAPEVTALAAPLLHLLQRATRLSPTVKNALLSADLAAFDRVSASLLKSIYDARTAAAEKVVLSKDTRVMVGLHYEEMFTHVM